MTIPHNEKMNFDALTDNYSISFWVKSGEPLPAGAASGRLLQKWNGILGYAYSYSFQMNNEALVFAIWDRSSADLCRFGNIWDDKWHHIVVTVDGDMDQIKCYLDGNLVDQKPITVSGSTKNELDVVMAVKSANETDALYKGLLDEISFHSRMLSPEEIQINAGK